VRVAVARRGVVPDRSPDTRLSLNVEAVLDPPKVVVSEASIMAAVVLVIGTSGPSSNVRSFALRSISTV
jgi:hypothetical protein